MPIPAARYPLLRPHSGFVIGSRDPEDLAGEVSCLVMVETREGLENVEEIAVTPGTDGGSYIGPTDLAISLGLPPTTSVTKTRTSRPYEG